MERALLRIVIVAWGLALSGGSLYGQSFAAGNAKYQRGDFKGAERALTQALKSEKDAGTRAKALKLLGICQFMLGNTSGAAQSFKGALALNPQLAIAPSEVLDDGVLPFFEKQKASGEKAAKKTLLKIASNVPDATVSVDGILAGKPGEWINAEPGTVEVEVAAPGYVTKRAKVTVVKNKETAATVNLEKPKTKPPAVASTRTPAGLTRKTPQTPKKTPAKKPGEMPDPYAPTPEDPMFTEPATRGAPGPGGADPTAEFERDTGGYPPGGQQPVYAIIVPQGQQQPGYEPPPPPAPPSYDPYATAYVEPPAPDPAARPEAGATVYGSGEKNKLVAVLPFGAGQFQNKSYALGVTFLVAEAYAGYAYLNYSKDADSAQQTRDQFVADKTAAGELSEDDRQWVANTDSYVSATRQKAQYAAAGFAALWVAGAVQAIVDDGPAEPAKSRRKSRDRRYSGFSYVPDLNLGLSPAAVSASLKWGW